MHRFLVPSEVLQCDNPSLPQDVVKHLKVVRVKEGEEVELFDGAGSLRTFRVTGKASVLAAGEIRTVERSKKTLALFACVTKGSRWDWTIEKAVELGATRIVPVISARSIVRLQKSERAAKAERWRRIAEDAARQSDAAWLPEIVEPLDFDESLELVKGCSRVFAGALQTPPPKPILTALADMPDDADSLGIYVGPEGDFTPEELSALLKIAQPVSLGPSILRAETAAVFGLSLLAGFCHARMTTA